jgi:hypothetical protein
MAGLSIPGGVAPFEIAKIERPDDGALVKLTIRSRPGRVYAVDFCTDLTAAPGTPGSWVELTDAVPSGGAETTYVDTIASGLVRAFYRARDVTP